MFDTVAVPRLRASPPAAHYRVQETALDMSTQVILPSGVVCARDAGYSVCYLAPIL